MKKKLIETELQLISFIRKRVIFERKQLELETSIACLTFFRNEKTSKTLLNQIENRIKKETKVYNEINSILLVEKIKTLETTYKNINTLLKKF